MFRIKLHPRSVLAEGLEWYYQAQEKAARFKAYLDTIPPPPRQSLTNHIKVDPRLKNRNNLFLRIGSNINQRSAFGLDDEWKKELGNKQFEDGVSVWWLRQDPQRGPYLYYDANRALYGSDRASYWKEMFQSQASRIANEEIFVLRGKLIAEPYRFNDDEESYFLESAECPINPAYEQWIEQYIRKDFPEKADEMYRQGMSCKDYYTYSVGADGEPLLKPGSVSVVKRLSLAEFRAISVGGAKVGDVLDQIRRFDDDEPEEEEEEYL